MSKTIEENVSEKLLQWAERNQTAANISIFDWERLKKTFTEALRAAILDAPAVTEKPSNPVKLYVLSDLASLIKVPSGRELREKFTSLSPDEFPVLYTPRTWDELPESNKFKWIFFAKFIRDEVIRLNS